MFCIDLVVLPNVMHLGVIFPKITVFQSILGIVTIQASVFQFLLLVKGIPKPWHFFLLCNQWTLKCPNVNQINTKHFIFILQTKNGYVKV